MPSSSADTVPARPLRELPGWRIPGTAAGPLADCSLVVATYRRPREILALLDTLAAMRDIPAEVAILDGDPAGGLSRALQDWAGAHDAPFDLLYALAPTGLTRQRNAGIDISKGEFVFFLDDDAVPLDGYFRRLRHVFRQDPDKRIGAAGAIIANEIDRPVPRRWRLRLALRLVPCVEPGTYLPCGTSTPRSLLKPFTGVRYVDIIPGGVSAFRREVFRRHRFSEFFQFYSQGEDMEMSLRIGRDWRLVSCGDALALHHPAPGGRPPGFSKGEMEVRNRFFIWRRYSPAAAAIDRARFWTDICFLAVMDLAWYAARPWRFRHLAHAAGVLRAAAGCLFRPPRYDEPPASRVYALSSAPAEAAAPPVPARS